MVETLATTNNDALAEMGITDDYTTTGLILGDDELDINLTNISINHDEMEFSFGGDTMVDDNGEPVKEFEAVIIAVFADRVRWEQPFDPENPTKLCWAPNGKTPHKDGDQYGKIDKCSECAFSKWDNSGPKGVKPSCTQQLNFIGVCADDGYFGLPFLLRAKGTSYNPAKRFLTPFAQTRRSRKPKLLKETLVKIGMSEGKYGKKRYGILSFLGTPLAEDLAEDLQIELLSSAEILKIVAQRYSDFSNAEGKAKSLQEDEDVETVEAPVAADLDEADVDL